MASDHRRLGGGGSIRATAPVPLHAQ